MILELLRAQVAECAEWSGRLLSLGLAIADSFARHMGGRLELHSPVSGEASGFEARLVLPVEKGVSRLQPRIASSRMLPKILR